VADSENTSMPGGVNDRVPIQVSKSSRRSVPIACTPVCRSSAMPSEARCGLSRAL